MVASFHSRVRGYRVIVGTALSVALFASACSSTGADSEGGDLRDASVSSGDLSGVSIDSSSIEELDVVRFNGIDVDGDMSQLRLQGITDGLEPMEMILFVDDDGIYTIFPLHPVNPGGGGDIVLRLTASDMSTQNFAVEVAGLPEAPGAWDRAVDTMIDGLESRAIQLGTNLKDISAAAMNDLADTAKAIKLVAGYVDDGTTNDLESLLVRPGAEFSTDEVGLIDSIVGKIGLEQLALPSFDASDPQAIGPPATAIVASSRPNAIRAAYAGADSCIENRIEIGDGDDLAEKLKKGLDARAVLDDPLYRAGNELASGTAAAAGAIAAASGVVAAVGVSTGVLAAPALAVAGPALTVAAGLGAVSTMYTTNKLLNEIEAGSYPTMFVVLDAAVDTPTFNEDFTTGGRIDSVKVTAASTGFNATEELSSIGAAFVGGSAGYAVGSWMGAAGESLPGVVKSAMGAHGILQDSATAEAIKQAKELLEFCAKRWTVGIQDERFVEVFAVNDKLKVDASSWTYEPKEVGADILRFETREAAFPGAFAIADVAVETLALEVVAEPIEIKVKRAGDTIDIAVELKNADTLTLWWEPKQGEWSDKKGPETNTETTRPLKTPADKRAYPFLVVVESTSRTGLRAESTDVRSATVKVTLQDLIVAPDPGKLRTNQTLQFTAKDSDGEVPDVTWTATGGTIVEDSGLYTAGKTPGTYSVTATSVVDPTVSGTAAVSINDGECFVGSWLLLSDAFFSDIGQKFDGDISYRSGENRLVVNEDGTYSTFRDAWSYEVATPEGTIVGTITAESTGTWITTETTLSFSETGGSDATVELLMEVGGSLVPLPFNPGSRQVPTGPIAGEFPYLCEGDVLFIFTDAVTSVFDRVDG